MPIVVCLKNGLQLVIRDGKINPSEWKPKARLLKRAMNGHPLLINAGEVVMLEEFSDDEYRERSEKVKAAAEAAKTVEGGRIARPVMVVPRGR